MAVEQILIDEDIKLGGQQGQIGECMEFCIRENVFMEILAFAQVDNPIGMFNICI